MAKKLTWLLEHSKQPFKLVDEKKINKRLYENAGFSMSNDPDYQKEYILEAPLIEFGEEGADNNLNENNRWYTKAEYISEVERLAEEISEGSMFGSPDHPEEGYSTSMTKVSHLVTKLWLHEDGRIWVRIKLIPTIIGGGCDLIAIHKAGGLLKGSARAIGFFDEDTNMATVDTLFTVDVVSSSGFEFVKFKEVSNANSDQFVVEMSEKDQKLYENKISNMKNNKKTIIPLNEAVSTKLDNWMIRQYNDSKKTINLVSKAIDQSKAIGDAVENFVRTLGIEPKETDVCVEVGSLTVRCFIKNENDNVKKISDVTFNDISKAIGEHDIFKASYMNNDSSFYAKDNIPSIFCLSVTMTEKQNLDFNPIQEIKTLFENKQKFDKKVRTKLNESSSGNSNSGLTDKQEDDVCDYYFDNNYMDEDIEKATSEISKALGMNADSVKKYIVWTRKIQEDMNESKQATPELLKVGESYLIKKGDMEAYAEYKGEKEGKYSFDNSGEETLLTAEELPQFVSLDEANDTNYSSRWNALSKEDKIEIYKITGLAIDDEDIDVNFSELLDDEKDRISGYFSSLNEKWNMNESLSLEALTDVVNTKWDDATVRECFMELIGTGETDIDKMKHELLAYFETEASENELKQWFGLNEDIDMESGWINVLLKKMEDSKSYEDFSKAITETTGVTDAKGIEEIAKKVAEKYPDRKTFLNESAEPTPEEAKARFLKFWDNIKQSDYPKFDKFKFDGSDDMEELHKVMNGASTGLIHTTTIYNDSRERAGDVMFENKRNMNENENNGIVHENGEPVETSFLMDMLKMSTSSQDFLFKVNHGITNEGTSVSPENDSKILSWYSSNNMNEDDSSIDATSEVEVTHPTEGEMSVLFNETPEGVEVVGVAPVDYKSEEEIVTADVLEGNETMEDYQDLVAEALEVENKEGDLSETSKKIMKRVKLSEAKKLRKKNLKRLNENNTDLVSELKSKIDFISEEDLLKELVKIADSGIEIEDWMLPDGKKFDIGSKTFVKLNESPDDLSNLASTDPIARLAKEKGMSYVDAKQFMADKEMNESETEFNSMEEIEDAYNEILIYLFNEDDPFSLKQESIDKANEEFTKKYGKSYDEYLALFESSEDSLCKTVKDEEFGDVEVCYTLSDDGTPIVSTMSMPNDAKITKEDTDQETWDRITNLLASSLNEEATASNTVGMGTQQTGASTENNVTLVENAVAEVDVIHPEDGEVSVLFNTTNEGEPEVVAIVSSDDNTDVVLAEDLEKQGALEMYTTLVNEELDKDSDPTSGNLSESNKKILRKLRLFEAKNLRKKRLNESFNDEMQNNKELEEKWNNLDTKIKSKFLLNVGQDKGQNDEWKQLSTSTQQLFMENFDEFEKSLNEGVVINGVPATHFRTDPADFSKKKYYRKTPDGIWLVYDETNGWLGSHDTKETLEAELEVLNEGAGYNNLWQEWYAGLSMNEQKEFANKLLDEVEIMRIKRYDIPTIKVLWERAGEPKPRKFDENGRELNESGEGSKFEMDLEGKPIEVTYNKSGSVIKVEWKDGTKASMKDLGVNTRQKIREEVKKKTGLNESSYDSNSEYIVVLDKMTNGVPSGEYFTENDGDNINLWDEDKKVASISKSIFEGWLSNGIAEKMDESKNDVMLNEKINNLSESVNKLSKKVDNLSEENDFLKKKLKNLTESEIEVVGEDEKTYKVSYNDEGKLVSILLDDVEIDFETLEDEFKNIITEAINSDFSKKGGSAETTADLIKINESKQIKKFKDSRPYLKKLNENQVIAVMNLDSNTLGELEDVLGDDKEKEMEVGDIIEMASIVGADLQPITFLS